MSPCRKLKDYLDGLNKTLRERMDFEFNLYEGFADVRVSFPYSGVYFSFNITNHDDSDKAISRINDFINKQDEL